MQAISAQKAFPVTGSYNRRMPGGRPAKKQAPLFGQRLSHFRTEKGLSQRQLAEELGISRDLIGYYERRCNNPTADILQRLCKVLDVTTDELVGSAPVKTKPGPAPVILQRIKQVQKLPPAKQKLVIDFLDTVIESES